MIRFIVVPGRMLRVLGLFALGIVMLLALAPFAMADVSGAPTHLVLPTDQIWAFVAGNLAPLFAYVLNHYAPWISEKIKVFAQFVVASIAGGLTQAITTGGVGFNAVTLQFVVTAVVGAFLAHAWVWQRSTVAQSLGGGSNHTDAPGTPR